MSLFLKYKLWNFFSIMLSFLLKDFINDLNRNLGEKVKITILKDKRFHLNFIPDKKWILIKNNIKNTTSGKIRFVISKEDFMEITKIIGKNEFINLFETIPKKLQLLTGINEIKQFSFSNLPNPLILGNIGKYYMVHILLKTKNITITLFFVFRYEMLLFPINRFPLNFLSKLTTNSYKKAFIELDKNIIWNGMQNWDKELTKKMSLYTKSYPAKKYKLSPNNNKAAYRLFLQYLHIIELLSQKKNIYNNSN